MTTFLKSIRQPLFLIIFLIFSCKNNESIVLTKNSYHEIGRKHNEGLARIFDHIKSERKNEFGRILSIDPYELAETSTKEFIRIEYPELTEEEFGIIDAEISTTIDSLQSFDIEEVGVNLMAEIDNVLNPNQKLFVDEIISAVTNGFSDIRKLQNDLSEIENRAFDLLDEDREIILLAIAVARSSSNYWSENKEEWDHELSNSGILSRTRAEINWGAVAGFDIAAAVLIGTATSTALVVPFVGWGFWAASVVGGTTIVSAAAALGQYYT